MVAPRTNGQPDRRFKNNPIVFRIKQGCTFISDHPHLEENKETFCAGLVISSPSIAQDFTSKIKKIFS